MTATNVSRLILPHPDLGTTGGAALEAAIHGLYKKIGDNIASRMLVSLNVLNAATATVNHDFRVAFGDLRYDLYIVSGTDPYDLVRVTATSSPALSAFTITANGINPTTQIDILNSSGATRQLLLVVHLDPLKLSEGDVQDVDVSTTAPQDGQALVYEASSSKWKPGASGDASFKLQAVSTPTLTMKGGYLGLDDGRELATYDGTGALSTDFGTDLALNLTTIFGSTPANATAYHLYVDLESLSAAVTQTDTGRKVLAVVQANFVLSTTTPDGMNKGRYVHLGYVRSATTGNAWSGAGAAFGTLATRKHDNGPIAISPVAYRLAQQTVGAVGSSGQVAAGHLLSTKSFPSAISAANRSWFPLAANANDGSGNANNLTNNAATPFTGANILGSAAVAAVLNGTTQYFSSTAAFFNPGNGVSFAVGGWFKATDWTPAANMALLSQWQTASDRGWSILVQSAGNFLFNATNTAAATDVQLNVPNPGFVDNTWHHIAMVFDFANTTLKAYIDGRLVASGTLSNVRAVSSALLQVGATNNVSPQDFFAGSVEDVFYAKTTTLTDEDIRKLYSYRVDHSKAVAAVNQQWDAAILGNCMTQDPSAWLVCKNDPDSVFWDFSDQASTDSVSVTMQDTGLSAAVVQARQPFDTTYASGAAANAAIGAGLAHGQAEVPIIYLQREVNTGEWETMDPTGKIRADASNLITEDLTTITERLRVRAVGGTLPTAAGTATATTAGLVKRYNADETTARLAASGDVTLTASDGYSLVSMTTGASDRTITLPAAASVSGRELTTKKVDSGAGKMIVDANGAETIDGATTTEITAQWAFVRLRSNGTSWEITG